MTDDAGTIAASGQRITAPCGSWASPITARLIAESGIALGGLQTAAGQLFWVEMRPLEDGRSVLVRRTADGEILDVVPATANTRTLVHEYGGGIYALHAAADGGVTAYYSEFEDQRLYRVEVGRGGGVEREHAAAVLVHEGARVGRRGDDVDDAPVGGTLHEHVAPVLQRTHLDPEQLAGSGL